MTVLPESSAFQDEIRAVITKHSKENGSNTPDFILAEYLVRCLEAFDYAVRCRRVYRPETEYRDAGGASPPPRIEDK